jgi:hypothetical protein
MQPIEFRIITNLQTALQAIAIAGGYHYTVVAAAVKLDPNAAAQVLVAPSGPRPFMLIEVRPETWEYSPANQLKLFMALTVHWVKEADQTADANLLETYLNGCADVERAIAVDISRGQLATDTRIVKREMDLTQDGAQVWARIDLEIRVHRTYGQPDS